MAWPITRCLTSLAVVSALFAPACDAEDGPVGTSVLTGTTDGAETDGEMSTGGTGGDAGTDGTGADAGTDVSSCDRQGESRVCGDEEAGVSFCDGMADSYEWGPCLTEVACMPGEVRDCNGAAFGYTPQYCYLEDGIPQWDEDACG